MMTIYKPIRESFIISNTLFGAPSVDHKFECIIFVCKFTLISYACTV